MLKLEDVYDVVVAKDGQEAYDMVKESMSKNQFFDLIFMDIQVSHTKSPLHSHFLLTRLDAESRWASEYQINTTNGIRESNRCVNSLCRGKQCSTML